MSTSFLSLPTGWQNILMTRKFRLSTPAWRPPGRRPCGIWPRNTARRPCAERLFFDIEALSDHTSPLPHMMPRAEAFAVAMRELGVCSDKHLVVYDEGNLFSAPRAWWMLRTFGVEKVSILAGGLEGWRRDDCRWNKGCRRWPKGNSTCGSILNKLSV